MADLADVSPAPLTAEQLNEAWLRSVDALRDRMGQNQGRIKLWLGDKVSPRELQTDGTFVLNCPTPLFSTQIRTHFSAELCGILADTLERPVTDIACRVTRHDSATHRKRLEAQQAEDQAAVAPRRRQAWGQGFKLLQDFVVGSCNRIAYDAVMRILEEPDNQVNPVFIHGSSGLGKTHLEQGLALSFKERYPHSNIIYMTCEQFRNAYLAAVEASALASFRVRLRHADLLLIDDIHFLSHGQAQKTKEELFATFNELSESGKKVVFTSDAHPSDIKYLEDRFVQRFTGGLVVMLDRPDLEVRREVVMAKARSQNVTLPPEVVDFVADHIVDNVRELEGAVNKLVAYANSFKRRIDLALVRQALADLIQRDAGEPLLKVILRSVADYFNITAEEILGKSRSGPRSTARHIAMYTLKASSNDTYQAVAQAFGIKSHSTVAYACEQVAKYRHTDPQLDAFVEELLLRLRRR